MRPYRGALALTLVAGVVSSALDGLMVALLIPFLRLLFGETALTGAPIAAEQLINSIVGPALGSERGTALRNIVLIILGTVALKNVAVYAFGALSAHIQEGVARDLRNALYTHVQQLGLGFYQRMKGGQLVSRVVSDTDQARDVVGTALISTMQQTPLLLVYGAILFSLSWRLTLLILLVAPITVLAMRPILDRIRSRVKVALHERGEVTVVTSETIEAARLVKAHGAEAYERRRFQNAGDRYFTEMVKARCYSALAQPVSETLGATVVLLLLVASLSLGSGATAGMLPEHFIVFLVVTLRLLSPAKALSQVPAIAEHALAGSGRLFEVMDLEPDDVDDRNAATFPGIERAIELQDVWFAYEPKTWVLKGVNLLVRRGDVVAIVGPSGAGKSTLVDLLPRFIEPQRGVVSIDGTPIARYSRRSLRSAMGIVSQHTVLFHDTVRANIAYGDQETASREAVEAAAQAANAHDFISRLPDGYDTIIGERGMRLSGGERQRVAIARALLRDPPILILDEATSALDTESQLLVQEAIARLLENRTVLVIAHRLSTVARADHIIVLDQGNLVECGNHEELVTGGGLYQRFHAMELVGKDR